MALNKRTNGSDSKKKEESESSPKVRRHAQQSARFASNIFIRCSLMFVYFTFFIIVCYSMSAIVVAVSVMEALVESNDVVNIWKSFS